MIVRSQRTLAMGFLQGQCSGQVRKDFFTDRFRLGAAGRLHKPRTASAGNGCSLEPIICDRYVKQYADGAPFGVLSRTASALQ